MHGVTSNHYLIHTNVYHLARLAARILRITFNPCQLQMYEPRKPGSNLTDFMYANAPFKPLSKINYTFLNASRSYIRKKVPLSIAMDIVLSALWMGSGDIGK